METEKKRYWLKLDKNFMKSTQINIIKNMPNGKDYVIFYLSLMLESIETIGHLRITPLIPYNPETLAAATNTNIDIVRNAIKIFCELGMMQIFDDGTIFLPCVADMTGKEGESAERVRIHREKQKLLQCNTDVTKCNDNKEKQRRVTENKEQSKLTEEEYTSFVELFNSIPELPKVSTLSETRKKKLKLRWNEGLKNEYENVIEKIKASDFLLGKVTGKDGRTWKATFDWLIENDTNWIKIIEGKYNQGESAPTEPKKTKEELTKTLNFYLRQGYDYEYIARNLPFLKEVIPCK
jgi:predicted phage replisome organizer